MNDLCRVARVWGLSFVVGFCGLAFGLSGLAWAQGQVGLALAAGTIAGLIAHIPGAEPWSTGRPGNEDWRPLALQ